MKKWEYISTWYQGWDISNDYLNEQGALGWELVMATITPSRFDHIPEHNIYLVFKREIKQPEV